MLLNQVCLMFDFDDVVVSAHRMSFSISPNLEASMHRAAKEAVARLNAGKAAGRIQWESGMLEGRAWFFFTFAPTTVKGWRRLFQLSTSALQHLVMRGIRQALANGGSAAARTGFGR